MNSGKIQNNGCCDEIKLAHRYRTNTGRHNGVVIIFNGQVSGWVNKLRNPEHWQPGCIAIDTDGNKYLAVGGNEYDGAKKWAIDKTI